MLGDVPTKHAIGKLLQYDFIDGFEPTPLGRVVTEHFLEPGQAFTLLDGIGRTPIPYELVADIELGTRTSDRVPSDVIRDCHWRIKRRPRSFVRAVSTAGTVKDDSVQSIVSTGIQPGAVTMDTTTPAAIDPPANVLLVHSRRASPNACEGLCYHDSDTAHLAVTFADEEPDCPDEDAIDGPLGQLTIGDVLTDAGDESEPDFPASRHRFGDRSDRSLRDRRRSQPVL